MRTPRVTRLCALLPIYGSHGLVDSASRRLYGGDWDGMGIHDLSNLLGDYLPTPRMSTHHSSHI